jgi:hypothetical protein
VDAEEFPLRQMLTNREKASDIGNRMVFSGNEWTSGEALAENVKVPLRLHCESVNRLATTHPRELGRAVAWLRPTG